MDIYNPYTMMQKIEYSNGTSNHEEHNNNKDYWDILLSDVKSKEEWKDKKALDFACGKGRNVTNLLSLADWSRVDGVDLSEANIYYCKEEYVNQNSEWYVNSGVDLEALKSEEYDFVIKDRYPFSLSNKFFADNTVLSWIPSVFPYAVGRNTIIKSFLADLPIGGTIFFIKSNDYLVDVVREFEIDVDPEIDTLKQVYDKITGLVMELLARDLSTIITKQKAKTSVSFKKVTPITTNEFFENVDVASALVNGYDTRLVDLNH